MRSSTCRRTRAQPWWERSGATPTLGLSEIDFVEVGVDLGPSGKPNRTYDVEPHAEAADFDDSDWRELDPPDTMLRLGGGKVCFNWYRDAGHDTGACGRA